MGKSKKPRSEEPVSRTADSKTVDLKTTDPITADSKTPDPGNEKASSRAKKMDPQAMVSFVRILRGGISGEGIPGVKKAAGLQETIRKRRRQWRYLSAALRVAIRLLNASGRKTIRVK